MTLTVNIRDALGKEKAKDVEHSYNEARLYRKAALSYLQDYRESLIKDMISDDNAHNDRSDMRLIRISELRLLEKLKKILD